MATQFLSVLTPTPTLVINVDLSLIVENCGTVKVFFFQLPSDIFIDFSIFFFQSSAVVLYMSHTLKRSLHTEHLWLCVISQIYTYKRRSAKPGSFSLTQKTLVKHWLLSVLRREEGFLYYFSKRRGNQLPSLVCYDEDIRIKQIIYRAACG